MPQNLVFTALQNLGSQLNKSYFGVPLEKYLIAVVIIIFTAVVGKLLVLIFRHHFAILAKKTKNYFDDLLLETFSKPLYFFVLLLGVFVAFQYLGIQGFLGVILNKIFITIFYLLLVWVSFKLVDSFVKYYVLPFIQKTDTDLDDQLLPVLVKVSKIGVVTIFSIMVLDAWGADVTALLAGVGIGGLAIAFAAQKTIADVFGGVSIFTSRPFKIGDFVELNGVKGTVEEVGLRYTRLRTPTKQFITLTNSSVAENTIINYSNTLKKGVDINIGLTYDTSINDLEKAKKVLRQILAEVKGIEQDPEPLIVFKSFGDFSINLFVRYMILDTSNYWQIVDKVNTEIKKRFDKEKLEFAFPTQTIYIAK